MKTAKEKSNKNDGCRAVANSHGKKAIVQRTHKNLNHYLDKQENRLKNIFGNGLQEDKSGGKSFGMRGSHDLVIQGWWPLGHQTITKKVLNEADRPKESFDKKSKDFLIKRSPDMDFIQDETNAMEKGIQDSEPKIKDFKAKVEENKDNPEAKSMWESNELHQRPQWYMMHHGEGGFYKADASTAAARNHAMTVSLVEAAAGMYNAGDIKASLSVLSDALHQAEDRGSHEEGESFRGHDIRQTIKPEYVNSEWNPKGHRYIKKPDPDNAAKNPGGAKRALFFASNALNMFLDLTKAKSVVYEDDAESARTRHSKINVGKGMGKLVATSQKIKTKFPGHTDAKTIEGIIKSEWSKVEDQKKGGLSFKDKLILRRAFDTYVIGWLTSELMEKIRAKRPKSKEILNFSYKTFDTMKGKHAALVSIYDPISSEERSQLVQAAVKNYQYQRARRYQSTEPAEVIEDI